MRRWAIFFGLFVVVIIIFADTSDLGPLGKIYDIPFGDKLGHFVLFGLLSLVVNLAVFEARPKDNKSRLALITCLILALLIGLEEFSQIWFPSRSFSLFDLAAGYLGVALFGWCAVRLRGMPNPNAGCK